MQNSKSAYKKFSKLAVEYLFSHPCIIFRHFGRIVRVTGINALKFSKIFDLNCETFAIVTSIPISLIKVDYNPVKLIVFTANSFHHREFDT